MKVNSLFITDLKKNAFGAQLIGATAGDLLQRRGLDSKEDVWRSWGWSRVNKGWA